MGRRGPPPTPTALRVLRGNPGRRALPANEPQPELATEDAPRGLKGPALTIWRDVAPQLVAVGLLSVIDRAHLARACRLEALGRRLLVKAERAPITETPANGRQPSAEFTASLKAFDAADRVWFRFGITPSERSRVKAGKIREPDDPFEAFKRKKRDPGVSAPS